MITASVLIRTFLIAGAFTPVIDAVAQPTHYNQRMREDYRQREATQRAYNTNSNTTPANNSYQGSKPVQQTTSGTGSSGSSYRPASGPAYTPSSSQMDAASQRSYDRQYEAREKARRDEQAADARSAAEDARNVETMRKILNGDNGQPAGAKTSQLQESIRKANIAIEPANYSKLRDLARAANYVGWQADEMFPADAYNWTNRKAEYKRDFPCTVALPAPPDNINNPRPYTQADADAVKKYFEEETLKTRKSELESSLKELNVEVTYGNVEQLRYLARKAGYTIPETIEMFPSFYSEWETRKKDW